MKAPVWRWEYAVRSNQIAVLFYDQQNKLFVVCVYLIMVLGAR